MKKKNPPDISQILQHFMTSQILSRFAACTRCWVSSAHHRHLRFSRQSSSLTFLIALFLFFISLHSPSVSFYPPKGATCEILFDFLLSICFTVLMNHSQDINCHSCAHLAQRLAKFGVRLWRMEADRPGGEEHLEKNAFILHLAPLTDVMA